jgi:type IV pilus assembly protein PilE
MLIDGMHSMNNEIIHNRPVRRSQAGFTLIELMVTVALLGILTSVAYPSFMDSVRKSNRNDAKTALARAVAAQERFFATNGGYSDVVTNIGFAADGLTEHGHYVITAAAGATGDIASSYVVTATAASGDMQADDTNCTVYSMNSLGVKTPSPTANTRCW